MEHLFFQYKTILLHLTINLLQWKKGPRKHEIYKGWKEVSGKRSARRNLQLDEKKKESVEAIHYAEVDIQEND